ncbi:hypothetical protein HD554DRAFT_2041708 [Boletus coccyginus]|nr:hypothetical protein HD554DRAFT_2041708 [Boletus coccyginus]
MCVTLSPLYMCKWVGWCVWAWQVGTNGCKGADDWHRVPDMIRNAPGILGQGAIWVSKKDWGTSRVIQTTGTLLEMADTMEKVAGWMAQRVKHAMTQNESKGSCWLKMKQINAMIFFSPPLPTTNIPEGTVAQWLCPAWGYLPVWANASQVLGISEDLEKYASTTKLPRQRHQITNVAQKNCHAGVQSRPVQVSQHELAVDLDLDDLNDQALIPVSPDIEVELSSEVLGHENAQFIAG